jgi:hypothetical protein
MGMPFSPSFWTGRRIVLLFRAILAEYQEDLPVERKEMSAHLY